MIYNRLQQGVALRKIDELKKGRVGADNASQAVFDALIAEVESELREYAATRDGCVRTFEVASVDDLARALISARVSRGYTQKRLADLLGVTEQAVQKNEAGGYERASLWKLAELADALGYELHGRFTPSEGEVTIDAAP